MENTFKTINPANGNILTSYTYITDAAVKNHIKKSHDAFLDWRLKSFDDKGKVIKAIGKSLQKHKK